MGQELWKAFLNGVLKLGFFSVRKESDSSATFRPLLLVS